MRWARFGSSSLRLASFAMRWGAVAVCALALMLEGVSHWRVVGVSRLRTAGQWTMAGTYLTFGTGIFRANHWRGEVDSDRHDVQFNWVCEPLRFDPDWILGHPESPASPQIRFGGFSFTLHEGSFNLAIPLYMIWLPMLPVAVWVIIRHIRRRKARRAKGFELVLPGKGLATETQRHGEDG